MHVRLDGLGMIDGVSSPVHRCAIGEVANGVVQVGPWQWCAGGMRIGLDSLRMIDGVASAIHRSTIWQVA